MVRGEKRRDAGDSVVACGGDRRAGVEEIPQVVARPSGSPSVTRTSPLISFSPQRIEDAMPSLAAVFSISRDLTPGSEIH
jgi:hypothetical protein